MTQLVNVKPEDFASKEKALFFCRELEKGNILFFLKAPFLFPQDEIDFLLQQRSKSSKEIFYDPESRSATGLDESNQMRTVLSSYSSRATEALSQLLSPYAARWKRDWASFRPFQKRALETSGEPLNVDAFAARPMHGSRILRFFTNIHPTEGKRWITSKSFSELAEEFAGRALPFPKSCTYSLGQRLERKMKGLLASSGLKGALRSPYDQFMLRLQRFLKQNDEFQQNCLKAYWDFPPGSCWAFFTDQVSHAALSGWHALEQVFLVPNQALLYPDLSPVSILERLTKGNMVDPSYV